MHHSRSISWLWQPVFVTSLSPRCLPRADRFDVQIVTEYIKRYHLKQTEILRMLKDCVNVIGVYGASAVCETRGFILGNSSLVDLELEFWQHKYVVNTKGYFTWYTFFVLYEPVSWKQLQEGKLRKLNKFIHATNTSSTMWSCIYHHTSLQA